MVASGQLIAFEGQSGDACGGHHLHWEVRDNADGVPINFNSWIRTAYNACPYGQSCLPTAPWVTAFAPISFRGEWYFTEGPDPSSEKRVMFGEPGDIPLMGDWNGDLYDTPGVVRFNPVTGNLRWYLHNKQIPLTYWGEPLGVAQGTWDWGTRNDYPINGDWVYSGTGPDGPGIVRKNTPPSTPEWWLSVPYAPYYLLFGYGADFDSPMIGDWYCASGSFDTPGVTRASSASGGSLRWLLSHGFPAAPAHDFTWGDYTDRPLAGRSVSSGLCTTPVIHRQETSSWFLNYGFDSSTEASFGFGDVNSYGLVADWDLDSYDEYVVAV